MQLRFTAVVPRLYSGDTVTTTVYVSVILPFLLVVRCPSVAEGTLRGTWEERLDFGTLYDRRVRPL